MDVRFSARTLHCQIGRAELDRLLGGRAVDLVVALPKHHALRVSVQPSVMPAERGGWQLASDPTGLWISIPRTEIELLAQSTAVVGRIARDFPAASNDVVRVTLEVEAAEEVSAPEAPAVSVAET